MATLVKLLHTSICGFQQQLSYSFLICIFYCVIVTVCWSFRVRLRMYFNIFQIVGIKVNTYLMMLYISYVVLKQEEICSFGTKSPIQITLVMQPQQRSVILQLGSCLYSPYLLLLLQFYGSCHHIMVVISINVVNITTNVTIF